MPGDDEQKRFGWKRTVVYTLLPAVVLFGGLEMAARVAEHWHPPPPQDTGLGFTAESRVYVPAPGEPEVRVTNPAKVPIFPEARFHARKPPGVLRVFFLGGSSVNYLADNPGLQNLKTRLLRAVGPGCTEVEIIVTGGLSHGSQRLVLIAGEALEYQPDAILLYTGHNEFCEMEQLHLARLDTLPFQRIVQRSALCRYLNAFIGSLRLGRMQREHNRRLLENPVISNADDWHHSLTPADVAARMTAFEQNLRLIIERCRDAGVPLVIGTVPSNLESPWIYRTEAERFETARALYAQGRWQEGASITREVLAESVRLQASDVENGIIRRLAAEYGLPLADVEQAVITLSPNGVPGNTLFNDMCHLNELGKAILLSAYLQQLTTLFGAGNS